LNEYFEYSLKIKPTNREEINISRISLGIVSGLDSYNEFIEYLHISKNKSDDLINFKKTGAIA